MNVQELFSLQGKTAVVTGGGRGLGYQIAEGLAEAGANIVLCSRKLEACEETAALLEKKGVQTAVFACDVTNQEQVEHVISETKKRFGTIDILVNNSGVTWGAPAADMPLEAWQKVMNVNVTGTFLMSQAAGRIMIEQQAGKIINIASVAGLKSSAPEVMDTIGYNTSKGAIITLTKDLASKWGQHNVHVNAVAPGFFPTKMSKVIIEHGGEAILANTPLGRFGGPDELKGVVVFLASRASDYVTGDVLIVDGGSHVR